MKQLNAKEVQERLNNNEPLFLVDEIEEIAYDFTRCPLLRVKPKGLKAFERMQARTNSETDALIAGMSMTEEEFEKY